MSDVLTASGEPDSSSSGSLVLPVAAIVCVCLTVFLVAVLILLCLRKTLQKRGVDGPQCSYCCEGWRVCGRERGSGCGERCKTIAETLDCSTPDCRVWLDSACPTKQQCSLWCGRLWSCYGCYIMADYCKNTSCNLCPNCAAFECPDVSCCGQCCHCTMKAPDCSHVACLCCDLDCGQTPTDDS